MISLLTITVRKSKYVYNKDTPLSAEFFISSADKILK